MPDAPAMLIVRSTWDPAHEAEFDDWYNHTHQQDVMRTLAGCRRARRFKAVGEGEPHALAVYEFDSLGALQAAMSGPGAQALIADFDATVGHFAQRSRTLYVQVAP